MNAVTMSLLQRPQRCANSHRPAPVQFGPVGVQRSSVGLMAVRFMPLVQAKLRIGAPRDKYELEAERVAAEVMKMPDSKPTMIDFVPGADTVQRECAACGGGDKLCSECVEEFQRQSNEGDPEPPVEAAPGKTPSLAPALDADIDSLRGSGQPLSASERAFFEPRFETNFSAVRVHTGSGAGELAQSLNARAFTVGSDIVLGCGQNAHASSASLKLLAHELTHVIQQGYARQTHQDWREKDKMDESQTAVLGGRFAAFPTTRLESKPANPEGFQIQDRQGAIAIASPMRQTEGSVVLRQEMSDDESSTVKGATPNPDASDFRYSETIVHDAEPLPPRITQHVESLFLDNL